MTSLRSLVNIILPRKRKRRRDQPHGPRPFGSLGGIGEPVEVLGGEREQLFTERSQLLGSQVQEAVGAGRRLPPLGRLPPTALQPVHELLPDALGEQGVENVGLRVFVGPAVGESLEAPWALAADAALCLFEEAVLGELAKVERAARAALAGEGCSASRRQRAFEARQLEQGQAKGMRQGPDRPVVELALFQRHVCKDIIAKLSLQE